MIKLFTLKNLSNQRGLVVSAGLVVGVVVAIIALIGAYELGSRHNSTNKNSAGKPQNSTAVKVITSAPVSAKQNVLTIKEYGIAVPLTTELQGLTYIAQTNPQHTLYMVNLKSDSYTTMTNKCLGLSASTSQYIAAIVKTNGTYDPAKNPGVRNLKQFESFYIADIGASQPAKVTCKDSSLQAQYDSLYAQLNSALDSSFANAKTSS